MDQDPAEHLIVSIGDESYLALPKGGLTSDHVLIIPLDHVTHPAAITDATRAEIAKFKQALQAHAVSHGKEMIYYERNAETKHGMVHCIIQCIPMKAEEGLSAKVEKAFEEIAGNRYNITFQVVGKSEEIEKYESKRDQYFLVELPDGRRLVHIVPPHSRHPPQLGREVLSELFGQQEKLAHWKKWQVSEDEERKTTQQFKSSFKPFDFTL